MVLACLSLLLTGSHVSVADPQKAHAQAVDPSPPSEVVKLIFIHRWKSSQSTTTYYVRPDGGSPE